MLCRRTTFDTSDKSLRSEPVSSQQDAEKRVADTYARMQAKVHEAANATKAAADTARKASSYAALWLFISLLIGAFVSSRGGDLGWPTARPLNH